MKSENIMWKVSAENIQRDLIAFNLKKINAYLLTAVSFNCETFASQMFIFRKKLLFSRK